MPDIVAANSKAGDSPRTLPHAVYLTFDATTVDMDDPPTLQSVRELVDDCFNPPLLQRVMNTRSIIGEEVNDTPAIARSSL